MAEYQGDQERTEQPTPKRLREAREKGQVARSKELNATAILFLGSAGLLVLGPAMLDGLQGLLRRGFQPSRAQLMNERFLIDSLMNTILDALWLIAPFLGLMLFAALLAPMALGGWVFSWQAIAFKANKLNPIKGLGRVFSANGLMELVKALGKFLVVGVVALVLFWGLTDRLLHLGLEPWRPALANAGSMFGWSFLALSLGLVLIAAVDVPFQIYQHVKQLKMSRQEIRDEMKETEGKPEVKSRIRGMQQQLARARMMEEVPTADVVITNPTHFAVALKYDAERMSAPVLVAKGTDLIAARIRELAAQHDISLVSAPPLARALYASTELKQEIPAALYMAVARVLAFVFQLRAARAAGTEPPRPPAPEVPEEFLAALRKKGKPID
jgi:flagellar biosynthetic protein FlhB